MTSSDSRIRFPDIHYDRNMGGKSAESRWVEIGHLIAAIAADMDWFRLSDNDEIKLLLLAHMRIFIDYHSLPY